MTFLKVAAFWITAIWLEVLILDWGREANRRERAEAGAEDFLIFIGPSGPVVMGLMILLIVVAAGVCTWWSERQKP